jgi:membrane fusion protein (multidrug efflux system)
MERRSAQGSCSRRSTHPSLDAQYAAAKASLGVAEANYRLAASTAQRWLALSGTPAVSQQEVDVQVAAAAARKAELEAAAQEVARYKALEGFKRVVAPFDGVVTARLTDLGSYVNAAGGDVSVRGSSTELFTIADVHEMRVFVSVPQDYANELAPASPRRSTYPRSRGNPSRRNFLRRPVHSARRRGPRLPNSPSIMRQALCGPAPTSRCSYRFHRTRPC